MAPVAGVAVTPPTDDIEIYYGFATVMGLALGTALFLIGQPAGVAAVAGFLAIVAGIAYEGLAHHHPGPAKRLAQVIVALAAVASAIGVVLILAAAAGALAGSGTSRRRRRS